MIYAKAFKKQSDPKKANCKISVHDDDAGKVLDNDFWPEHAFARYWYNHNDKYKNDNSSSDESLTE